MANLNRLNYLGGAMLHQNPRLTSVPRTTHCMYIGVSRRHTVTPAGHSSFTKKILVQFSDWPPVSTPGRSAMASPLAQKVKRELRGNVQVRPPRPRISDKKKSDSILTTVSISLQFLLFFFLEFTYLQSIALSFAPDIGLSPLKGDHDELVTITKIAEVLRSQSRRDPRAP